MCLITQISKKGLRYVDELLLQHHNFKLSSDYESLVARGIEVFSVRTDAFEIKPLNLGNAKECMTFHHDI